MFLYETSSKPGPSATTGINSSSSAITAAAAKRNRIVLFPRPSGLHAKLGLPKLIHLEKKRAIEIEISSGWNDITYGELRLRAAKAGLRLHTADAEMVDDPLVEIVDKTKPGIITFGDFPPHYSAKFRIPYQLDNDLNDLSIKLEVEYTTEKGNFLFASTPEVSIALPLGVNVQDIFKQKALFSKFTVSSSTNVPIRIKKSTLEGSDLYEASTGNDETNPLLVFSKQSASFIYKITRRKSIDKSKKDAKKPLGLLIEYRLVDEEIQDAIESVFKTSIEKASLQEFTHLLLPVIINSFMKKTLPQFEKIALLGEVAIEPFDIGQWGDPLLGIPDKHKDKVIAWLKEWHQTNATIPLHVSFDDEEDQCREILIPVEVPQVQVVHTAELHLVNTIEGVDDSSKVLAVEQMLTAELRIKHTRHWDSAGSTPSSKPLEFVYDIHANQELWLVAGKKRVHFSAVENETQIFPVLLLPLRAGHLLLPTVEIRPFVVTKKSGETEARTATTEHTPEPGISTLGPPSTRRRRPSSVASGGPLLAQHIANVRAMSEERDKSPVRGPAMTCETEYKNQGETVLVLADIRTTTVRIETGGGDPMAAAGLVTLLECDRWDRASSTV
jgi:trafficking protein particle complex subunit 10